MFKVRSALIFLLLIGQISIGKSQQTFGVSGGTSKSNAGSVSFTLGQVSYISSTKAATTVSQGVQQAFETFELPGGFAAVSTKYMFSIYPNPANQSTILSLDSIDLRNAIYIVKDLQGREVIRQNIMGSRTTIPLEACADGTYTISVYNKEEFIHTFLLVKS